MSFYQILLLSMALPAVLSDLKQMRIPNQMLYAFWVLGLCYRIACEGGKGILSFLAGAVVPICLLLFLFVFRMLGPGDIKLLSALGGVMGPGIILQCIIWSFLTGAILSAAILLATGSLSERLRYFTDYFLNLYYSKKRKAYYRKGNRYENIHFTIPILFSVLLHMGGLY